MLFAFVYEGFGILPISIFARTFIEGDGDTGEICVILQGCGMPRFTGTPAVQQTNAWAHSRAVEIVCFFAELTPFRSIENMVGKGQGCDYQAVPIRQNLYGFAWRDTVCPRIQQSLTAGCLFCLSCVAEKLDRVQTVENGLTFPVPNRVDIVNALEIRRFFTE